MNTGFLKKCYSNQDKGEKSLRRAIGLKLIMQNKSKTIATFTDQYTTGKAMFLSVILYNDVVSITARIRLTKRERCHHQP